MRNTGSPRMAKWTAPMWVKPELHKPLGWPAKMPCVSSWRSRRKLLAAAFAEPKKPWENMGPVPEDWPHGQAKVREDWTAETPRIGGFRPHKIRPLLALSLWQSHGRAVNQLFQRWHGAMWLSWRDLALSKCWTVWKAGKKLYLIIIIWH